MEKKLPDSEIGATISNPGAFFHSLVVQLPFLHVLRSLHALHVPCFSETIPRSGSCQSRRTTRDQRVAFARSRAAAAIIRTRAASDDPVASLSSCVAIRISASRRDEPELRSAAERSLATRNARSRARPLLRLSWSR